MERTQGGRERGGKQAGSQGPWDPRSDGAQFPAGLPPAPAGVLEKPAVRNASGTTSRRTSWWDGGLLRFRSSPSKKVCVSVQRVWPHDVPDGGAGQRDLGRRMPHVSLSGRPVVHLRLAALNSVLCQ